MFKRNKYAKSSLDSRQRINCSIRAPLDLFKWQLAQNKHEIKKLQFYLLQLTKFLKFVVFVKASAEVLYLSWIILSNADAARLQGKGRHILAIKQLQEYIATITGYVNNLEEFHTETGVFARTNKHDSSTMCIHAKYVQKFCSQLDNV